MTDKLDTALRRLAPGVGLSVAITMAAVACELLVSRIYPVPAVVIALVLGVMFHRAASQAIFEPGIGWCVKRLLRAAVGLLGVRVALGDIADLGLGTAILVGGAMVMTLVSGFLLARLFGLAAGYGAFAGAATAVCGASAALAASAVVPDYPRKGADMAFAVVAANIVSTLVMVVYPPLCLLLGFEPQTTGVMLGATIHDMAQVVGAGYMVSEPVGNTAVVVKLFRVFLLLPLVLVIGWWFARSDARHGKVKVPVPVFAFVFLALCMANSIAPEVPSFAALYAPIKSALVTASAWGLLVAIAALGLGTSVTTILSIGWRHVAVFLGTTAVIFIVVLTSLLTI